jgi:CheY-like chemotaxis protein
LTAPVLVVEDDPDIREVLAMALGDLGYRVATACDGLEAMRQLLAGLRPSMVLLDMMMPHMDGAAVVHAMRRHPELADVPIALFSGHRSVRQIAESLHLAASLVKPIELDELRSAVERIAGPP